MWWDDVGWTFVWCLFWLHLLLGVVGSKVGKHLGYGQ